MPPERHNARPPQRRKLRPCAPCWPNWKERQAEPAHARGTAVRAERQNRSGEAVAALQRQAALETPIGAGTMAAAKQARGQRQLDPVAGTIVRSWGEPTEGGPATGVSYHAPPSARVVAPCGGRVVFAAPFRSYGLLLIVDCGAGYHVVLAGLDRLDARVGQQVAAGEPIGVMPGVAAGRIRQPAGIVCRAQARWTTGEPGTMAESKRLISHRLKN